MQKSLDDIVNRLKKEDTRWDAILELKVLDGEEWVDPLVKLLSDSDWVLRWCVSEKLGDMGHTRAIRPLIRLLGDPDFHVRKNAVKSLVKFGSHMIPVLVRYFAHQNPVIRRQVLAVLLSLGPTVIPDLEACLDEQNWVVANRVVDTIWRLGGPQSETALIRAISNGHAQKHAIVLLGVLRSKRAIPNLMRVFDEAKLRRVVLFTLYRIGEEASYPVIVEAMLKDSGSISKLAEKIVLKVGVPMLKYLLKALMKSGGDARQILDVIFKIDPQKVASHLEKIAGQRPEVARALEAKGVRFSKSEGFLSRLGL